MKNQVPIDRPSGVRLRDDDAIARAAHGAAVGLEVAGRRARTRDVAERMTTLARDVRAIAETIGGGVRRPSTSERLRWEWLVSTSTVLDGGPERRVTDEAMRTLEAVLEEGSSTDDVESKLRHAVAQCRALLDEPSLRVA